MCLTILNKDASNFSSASSPFFSTAQPILILFECVSPDLLGF